MGTTFTDNNRRSDPPVVMIFLAIAGDTLDTLMNGLIVLSFGTSAERALITDDTGISAYGIAVNGVVDSAVADTLFLHAADDLLEC